MKKKDIWFFMLCERKDSRTVMRFGKKLNKGE